MAVPVTLAQLLPRLEKREFVFQQSEATLKPRSEAQPCP